MNPLDYKIQKPNNDCNGCHFDGHCTIKINGETHIIEDVQILDAIHGDCACNHIYVKKPSIHCYPLEL